jgi:RNA polymerase sigma-70 factor (ECF subfamily)
MVYMGETNMTQMDDERRIIDQVRRGDTQLYARLVTRHQGPIYNLMFRMTRSEDQAFDLSQETFVRAFEKLDGFDTDKAFFPWLYTLGMNVARDHLRKHVQERQSTQSLELLSGETADVPDPSCPHDQAADRVLLEQALGALPHDTREALIMRFREGFSYQEIAHALDIGLSNAKMKIHRGLELMRATLRTEYES